MTRKWPVGLRLSVGLILATAVAWVVLILACGPPPIPERQMQSMKAAQAADNLTFTENAEIENIQARLKLTSAPGALGYVLLINESGQPITYVAVKGKITSSGKRLTDPDTGPSDEGTWGSSDPYIYFWSTSGQYYQWNGKYLYSDKPFRLRIEPLVVDIVEGN